MDENKENLIKVLKENIIEDLNNIISCNVAIWRKNKDGNYVTIPIDKIKQYVGESDDTFEFFIEKDWKNKIKDQQEQNNAEENSKQDEEVKKAISYVKRYGEVEDQLKNFQLMSVVEREEILDNSIENLYEIKEGNSQFDILSVIKMVEVIANTFYSNHANLEDNLSSDNLKNSLTGVYTKSDWVVKLIIEYFKNNEQAYNELHVIDEIKTGSYTVDHLNKVLLLFINYCIFYNDFIDKGHVAKNIRGVYKTRYNAQYKLKLPGNDVSLETIFKDGMRRIELETELKEYALGALLFDIGKLSDFEYHDSDAPYDENTVKLHALVSYNMIIKAKEYPFVVAAMAALHHEYYGGKGSYNFTNPLLSKLLNKKRSEEDAKYFMTFDEEQFKNGVALAFFPCKVIEILDIFNALNSKKGYSKIDSLKLMKKEFIYNSFKIDPILFEIFLEFSLTCQFITPEERLEVDDIKIN